MSYRVGQGVDIHRFRAGRPLKLCGVELDGEVGLEGHSDADVALHAVTDAILGAVSAGDIGEHFPPTDARWKDADSTAFVLHALELVADQGFEIVNCDLTIVGERPRLAPHRDRLRAALAEILDVPMTNVSIKATTAEGMGWIGRGEGLLATAVVLLAARGAGGAQ
ncbi:MAG: 2-C-methyl-D-erythritol 2,4-cyclodiphosphate synthase [Acidobacteria bacterium]|jgi:2-C-methyl-D-erythritol 4-phosphate cytidylyltransferase / 2-C-methyl-D-erythritol 2,4-cyclodiphosphate synthase|nr:2-C-methyl-D-erythritol 2,4-cyclodiphosphate synthase [Acidobacteriota bacterium]